MGVIKQIEVSAEDRVELERIVRAMSSEVRMAERARIVLASAEGLRGKEIAARVGCSEPTRRPNVHPRTHKPTTTRIAVRIAVADGISL